MQSKKRRRRNVNAPTLISHDPTHVPATVLS